MNPQDPITDLESLLRRPLLRKPTSQLDAQLQTCFTANRRNYRPFALAAAILLCVGIAIWSDIHHQTAPMKTAMQPPPQQIIQVEKVSSQIFDDGIVAVADNVPYQQLRRRTVRNVVLIDPQTHSRLQLIVPTDQVIITKAETY
jgi:hypothetical protein